MHGMNQCNTGKNPRKKQTLKKSVYSEVLLYFYTLKKKGDIKEYKKMFPTTKRTMSQQDNRIENQTVSYLLSFCLKLLHFILL